MAIHPSRRRRRTRRRNIEGRVHLSQRLPVRLQVAHRRQRHAGVVLGVRGRGDDRAQRGLARRARKRRRSTVDRVGARLPCSKIGGQLPAGGVVGVHVHRQVEPAAQRTDQRRCGGGRQQSGHVLDRQHVRAGVDDLLGQLEVIVQRVEVFARVGQVAGVAHRDFGYRRTGFADRIDGGPHRFDVVERIEDAVDVDARRGRFLDECPRDGLRIRRVADGVAPAQQHLQADVRHRLTQRREPLPGILLQEPKRHIVCRAAPALDRQKLRGHPRDVRRHHEQAGGPQPGRQQRLVRVAERRIRDTDRLAIRASSAAKPFGPEFGQPLFGPRRWRRRQIDVGQLVVRIDRRRPRPVRLVDRDVGEVIEDLGAAVGRCVRGQQIRTVVDERRRDTAGAEVRIVDHGQQERDVRRHPAHAELGQRATRPGDRRRISRVRDMSA